MPSAEIIDGYGVGEACEGARGQLLLPWPNRIAHARFRFGGEDFQLPVNEARTGSAIHGVTRAMPWARDATASAVTLKLELEPQDGYPFTLELLASYSLAEDGLTVRIAATNCGKGPCPYGAGAHPYVRLRGDGMIDDSLLRIPAETTLESDSRGIPTGAELPVHGTRLDFRRPRRIGSLVLDTAFTKLAPDADGLTRIALTAPGGRDGVGVWMDASFPTR